MRKVVVWSENDVRYTVVQRLQKKFPESLILPDNELTRAIWILEKNEEQARNFQHRFINEDIKAETTDEYLFFAIVDAKLSSVQKRLFTVLTDVYGEETRWRYFIMNNDGNLDKRIRNVVNYDIGLVVSGEHLPNEDYEWILS